MSESKECKYCLTKMDTRCKKCPNCKEWVSLMYSPSIFIALTLFALGFGVQFWFKYKVEKIYKDRFVNEFVSANHHRLKILWHRPENNQGAEKYVIGEIKNEGKDKFDSVTIQASFFDNKKNLIKIGNTYIQGKFNPGETKKFEITYSCGKCDIKKMYDSYELEVIDASFPIKIH